MPKYTGKNATISFGGNEYLCLVDVTMAGSVDSISAACSAASGNAVTHKAIGAETWTVNATILLDSQSIQQEADFAPGVSGALIVYPNGNDLGNKSFEWVSAYVTSDNEPVAVASMATMAITFECEGSRTPKIVV